MSHSTYNKQWDLCQTHLTDLIEIEIPVVPVKPEKDKIAAFQTVAVLYVRYIQIFRQLEECYDQIVHPQKLRVIRHVLDGVMGRILEMKNEMMMLEHSEFHFLDDVLADLKLTPSDIEMPIPKFFIRENSRTLKEREKMLGTILAKMGPQDDKKMVIGDGTLLCRLLNDFEQLRIRMSQ